MSNDNQQNQNQPAINELGATLEAANEEWKNWIITAGIAAVIVLSVILYRTHNASNEEKSSQMLGEARNAQALQSIIQQYPGTSSARLALLQSAKAQYDNGDFVGAQSGYRDFIKKYPSHPMATMAELGIIHCTEGLGNLEGALKDFNDFSIRNPQHFLMPMAVFGKARCLQEMKRYAEARSTYEDFIAANPTSPWISDVNEALKQLASESRRHGVTR